MDFSSEDMDSVSMQKELAVEAEAVHANVDGTDVPHHKSKKEKRLVLKQDLSIVVLLSGCYWFAYLVCWVHSPEAFEKLTVSQDRGALGNARIMGFQTDLGLSGKQFYNCLMMFCQLAKMQDLYSADGLRTSRHWIPGV
jgi:hypothetical protein